MNKDKSCWECKHKKTAWNSLLGNCKARSLKEIPPHIVDKGCGKWATKWKIIKKV